MMDDGCFFFQRSVFFFPFCFSFFSFVFGFISVVLQDQDITKKAHKESENKMKRSLEKGKIEGAKDKNCWCSHIAALRILRAHEPLDKHR